MPSIHTIESNSKQTLRVVQTLVYTFSLSYISGMYIDLMESERPSDN